MLHHLFPVCGESILIEELAAKVLCTKTFVETQGLTRRVVEGFRIVLSGVDAVIVAR